MAKNNSRPQDVFFFIVCTIPFLSVVSVPVTKNITEFRKLQEEPLQPITLLVFNAIKNQAGDKPRLVNYRFVSNRAYCPDDRPANHPAIVSGRCPPYLK